MFPDEIMTMEWETEAPFQEMALMMLRWRPDLVVYNTRSLGGSGGMPESHKGAADIVVCSGGSFIALELKSRTRDLTVHQKSERKRVAAAGGRYACVYTLSQICTVIDQVAKGSSRDRS